MKKGLILILTFNLLFLTSCWSYKEIERFAIASALSVDKDSNGNYLLLAETIELNPNQAGLGFDTIFVESMGKTILEAAVNMISTAQKRLYWSHAKVIIISEEVAKDGIVPILDWIIRDPFPRPTIHLYIAKNSKARELLENESRSTKVQTFEFEETIDSLKFVAKSPHIEAYRLANQVVENNIYSVLPVAELIPKKNSLNIDISGSAFFRRGKLEGFLDPMDTMKYLFIMDEIKSGLLVVNLDEGNKDYITLQIKKNKTKIHSNIMDDKITMILNLKTHVSINEIDNEIDYTSREGRKLIKETTEKFIEEELKSLIKKMQKKYDLDIFQFGDHIKKNYPNQWKKVEKDWDSIFKDLDVVVNSTVYIEGSGHITTQNKGR